jgi:hypothetical protein
MEINGICPVCLKDLCEGSTFTTVCGHVFCVSCCDKMAKLEVTTCPYCRANMSTERVGGVQFVPEVEPPYPPLWYMRLQGRTVEDNVESYLARERCTSVRRRLAELAHTPRTAE